MFAMSKFPGGVIGLSSFRGIRGVALRYNESIVAGG
jgi:hypothetical protein